MSTITPQPVPLSSAGVRRLALLTLVYSLELIVYLILRFLLRNSLWWLAFLHNFTPYYFLPLLILLPLLYLLRARRMALRLLPVLLIGLLLYGPRWLPRNVAAASGTSSFKVVTFNILVHTHDFTRMAAWLRSTDADLILLQEVLGVTPDQVFSAMGDAYPYHVDLSGTSVVMLSRFPVTQAENINLGTSWFIDRAEVATESGPLAVYNVHMAWPFDNDPHLPISFGGSILDLPFHYDKSRRDVLIHSLLDILQGEELPYIAAGDFNTSDNALIYNSMAAVMRDSYRETNTGSGATWPASPGDDPLPAIIPPLLRLDYVWHSPDMRAVATEIGPSLGSDHLPMIATLQK